MKKELKILSNGEPSFTFDQYNGRMIKLIKAFSMNDKDFLRYPSLSYSLKRKSGEFKEIVLPQRSFASHITPMTMNPSIIEFGNVIVPIGDKILFKIHAEGHDETHDFKIGIEYEIIK